MSDVKANQGKLHACVTANNPQGDYPILYGYRKEFLEHRVNQWDSSKCKG